MILEFVRSEKKGVWEKQWRMSYRDGCPTNLRSCNHHLAYKETFHHGMIACVDPAVAPGRFASAGVEVELGS